jgi:LPPG:FO 2-phospho-L-lactate transferase
VLAGGVGAARFLRGLIRRTDERRLSVVVNTADDDVFFGLHVSPDVDTVLYTLGGLADPVRGWGRRDETFAALGALGTLGEPTWFRVGDRDLATHLFRTERLRRGWTPSRVTAALAARYGVRAWVRPMTDATVRTWIHTRRGRLSFQDYLVGRGARDAVRRVEIAGARRATPAPGVVSAIARADVVIFPPSNPLVSTGPILAIPAIRAAVRARRGRRVAVAPIVAGRAVRGPLHRMLRGLGHAASPVDVARLYAGLVDVFVLDVRDRAAAPRVRAFGMDVVLADTLMHDATAAARLASTVLGSVDPQRP